MATETVGSKMSCEFSSQEKWGPTAHPNHYEYRPVGTCPQPWNHRLGFCFHSVQRTRWRSSECCCRPVGGLTQGSDVEKKAASFNSRSSTAWLGGSHGLPNYVGYIPNNPNNMATLQTGPFKLATFFVVSGCFTGIPLFWLRLLAIPSTKILKPLSFLVEIPDIESRIELFKAQHLCVGALHSMPTFLAFLIAVAAEPNNLVVVPLDKQYVPIYRGENVVAYKTAYFGDLLVGSPSAKFSVVFDTGSGHMFLPSVKCDTESCHAHRRPSRRDCGWSYFTVVLQYHIDR